MLRMTNSSPGTALNTICGSVRLSEQAITSARGCWPNRLNSSKRLRSARHVPARKRRYPAIRSSMSAARWDRCLDQHHHGIFDQRLKGTDQHRTERAIDGAVIARQRHAHDVCGFDLAVPHHRALLASADRENRGVWRIDHGGKILDAVHAEVR